MKLWQSTPLSVVVGGRVVVVGGRVVVVGGRVVVGIAVVTSINKNILTEI